MITVAGMQLETPMPNQLYYKAFFLTGLILNPSRAWNLHKLKKRQGHRLAEIARALGRCKSTISRELKRNSTPAYRVYLSCKAHERAVTRKKESGQRPRLKNERIVSLSSRQRCL